MMKRKDQGVDIVPKRSFISPDVVGKRRKAGAKAQKEDRPRGDDDDLRLTVRSSLCLLFVKRKNKLSDEPEKIEVPLAQDVAALVDLYRDSSAAKKAELMMSVGDIHDRLRTRPRLLFRR